MLTLIQTLIDIIRLRKGPDAIPYSMVLFAMVVALWILVAMLGEVALPDSGASQISKFVVPLAGLSLFMVIVMLERKNERLLQMTTALVGCSAVLSTAWIIVFATTLRFEETSVFAVIGQMAALVVFLLSIVVDGHIVSRTLERPRIYGIVIAILVFAVQQFLHSAMNPAQVAAA